MDPAVSLADESGATLHRRRPNDQDLSKLRGWVESLLSSGVPADGNGELLKGSGEDRPFSPSRQED